MARTGPQDDAWKDLVARIDERTRSTDDDVKKIKHVLIEGNGSPPLTVTVARSDEQLKSIDGRLKAVEDAGPKRLSPGDRAMVYTSLISAFITLIEMIWRHAH